MPMAILMVFVLNREEYLDEILSGFVELGIGGATIIDSMGMGRILSHDIPIFAGMQDSLSSSSANSGYNRVFSGGICRFAWRRSMST